MHFTCFSVHNLHLTYADTSVGDMQSHLCDFVAELSEEKKVASRRRDNVNLSIILFGIC